MVSKPVNVCPGVFIPHDYLEQHRACTAHTIPLHLDPRLQRLDRAIDRNLVQGDGGALDCGQRNQHLLGRLGTEPSMTSGWRHLDTSNYICQQLARSPEGCRPWPRSVLQVGGGGNRHYTGKALHGSLSGVWVGFGWALGGR